MRFEVFTAANVVTVLCCTVLWTYCGKFWKVPYRLGLVKKCIIAHIFIRFREQNLAVMWVKKSHPSMYSYILVYNLAVFIQLSDWIRRTDGHVLWTELSVTIFIRILQMQIWHMSLMLRHCRLSEIQSVIFSVSGWQIGSVKRESQERSRSVKITAFINQLKHSGNYMYHLLKHSITLHFARSVVMGLIRNSE